ncbi:GNAT family N-acetyltransferase [Anaerolineae bacterium CFX7]|nr:GNAT family N-acetyltransferase [Anaerolineae bacterium CFX7]
MTAIPRIETQRLVLREIRESDAEAVFEIFGDDAVTRYYDLATFTDVDQARLLIARMNARNANGDALRWGIALRENDVVIGTGGFNAFARGWLRAGIGYDLARAYWNRGYMTEALRAMAQYGFEKTPALGLALNRIEALVVPGNVASARVLTKVGFQREGILREYGFWKNRFWDLEMFALLKQTWNGDG